MRHRRSVRKLRRQPSRVVARRSPEGYVSSISLTMPSMRSTESSSAALIPITFGLQLQRGGKGSATRAISEFVHAIADYLQP